MGQVSVLDTLSVVRVPTHLPNAQILTFPGTVLAAHDENDEILNMARLPRSNTRMGEGSTRSRGPVRLSLVPVRLSLVPVRLSLVPNYNLTSSYYRFGLLGGRGNLPIGTFSTYRIVPREQDSLTPVHLDDVHAAAWPVAGVRAWRYVRPRIISPCIVLTTKKNGHSSYRPCHARTHSPHHRNRWRRRAPRIKAMLSPRRACIRYEQLRREICTRRRARRYRRRELHAQGTVSTGSPSPSDFSNLQCTMIFCISDYRICPRLWGCSLENHHLTWLSIRLGGTIAQQIGRVLRQGGCIVMFGMRPRLRHIHDA